MNPRWTPKEKIGEMLDIWLDPNWEFVENKKILKNCESQSYIVYNIT